ncbi:hypothetical protein VOLCADRAFT_87105 [Volvox carteri f. nagariensis]|uniref:Uncharacterized protein n=1 Tax=Volvox carteri f. nagariensis TaxID=3068 RepID=D8TK66_VOLCA|nr:uncharacterized protein VOLCADRAFT_87105 [Volvox carteri f. nagariensis]EFJ52195.1 hypothetical protein VOLCADRAFT_87105 [Volvox carteri f. nagariensis]|eukprot:XP_002946969.1 hypothetical protein VOLCADRAFT_87105 [Volvox carteri f. nagariensis]
MPPLPIQVLQLLRSWSARAWNEGLPTDLSKLNAVNAQRASNENNATTAATHIPADSRSFVTPSHADSPAADKRTTDLPATNTYGATEPYGHQPNLAEPSTAQPNATQPIAAQSITAELGVTQPSTAEPSSELTNSNTADPHAPDPRAAQDLSAFEPSSAASRLKLPATAGYTAYTTCALELLHKCPVHATFAVATPASSSAEELSMCKAGSPVGDLFVVVDTADSAVVVVPTHDNVAPEPIGFVIVMAAVVLVFFLISMPDSVLLLALDCRAVLRAYISRFTGTPRAKTNSVTTSLDSSSVGDQSISECASNVTPVAAMQSTAPATAPRAFPKREAAFDSRLHNGNVPTAANCQHTSEEGGIRDASSSVGGGDDGMASTTSQSLARHTAHLAETQDRGNAAGVNHEPDDGGGGSPDNNPVADPDNSATSKPAAKTTAAAAVPTQRLATDTTTPKADDATASGRDNAACICTAPLGNWGLAAPAAARNPRDSARYDTCSTDSLTASPDASGVMVGGSPSEQNEIGCSAINGQDELFTGAEGGPATPLLDRDEVNEDFLVCMASPGPIEGSVELATQAATSATPSASIASLQSWATGGVVPSAVGLPSQAASALPVLAPGGATPANGYESDPGDAPQLPVAPVALYEPAAVVESSPPLSASQSPLRSPSQSPSQSSSQKMPHSGDPLASPPRSPWRPPSQSTPPSLLRYGTPMTSPRRSPSKSSSESQSPSQSTSPAGPRYRTPLMSPRRFQQQSSPSTSASPSPSASPSASPSPSHPISGSAPLSSPPPPSSVLAGSGFVVPPGDLTTTGKSRIPRSIGGSGFAAPPRAGHSKLPAGVPPLAFGHVNAMALTALTARTPAGTATPGTGRRTGVTAIPLFIAKRSGIPAPPKALEVPATEDAAMGVANADERPVMQAMAAMTVEEASAFAQPQLPPLRIAAVTLQPKEAMGAAMAAGSEVIADTEAAPCSPTRNAPVPANLAPAVAATLRPGRSRSWRGLIRVERVVYRWRKRLAESNKTLARRWLCALVRTRGEANIVKYVTQVIGSGNMSPRALTPPSPLAGDPAGNGAVVNTDGGEGGNSSGTGAASGAPDAQATNGTFSESAAACIQRMVLRFIEQRISSTSAEVSTSDSLQLVSDGGCASEIKLVLASNDGSLAQSSPSCTTRDATGNSGGGSTLHASAPQLTRMNSSSRDCEGDGTGGGHGRMVAMSPTAAHGGVALSADDEAWVCVVARPSPPPQFQIHGVKAGDEVTQVERCTAELASEAWSSDDELPLAKGFAGAFVEAALAAAAVKGPTNVLCPASRRNLLQGSLPCSE